MRHDDAFREIFRTDGDIALRFGVIAPDGGSRADDEKCRDETDQPFGAAAFFFDHRARMFRRNQGRHRCNEFFHETEQVVYGKRQQTGGDRARENHIVIDGTNAGEDKIT